MPQHRLPASGAIPPEQLERDRPVLYALRHLVQPVLGALLPLLGLGALFRAWLPRLDWLWVPAPIRDKFTDGPPGWLEPVVGSSWFQAATWAVPILIALLVAVAEVRKRQLARPGSATDQGTDQAEHREGSGGAHR